jgi:hypothetical protein
MRPGRNGNRVILSIALCRYQRGLQFSRCRHIELSRQAQTRQHATNHTDKITKHFPFHASLLVVTRLFDPLFRTSRNAQDAGPSDRRLLDPGVI